MKCFVVIILKHKIFFVLSIKPIENKKKERKSKKKKKRKKKIAIDSVTGYCKFLITTVDL